MMLCIQRYRHDLTESLSLSLDYKEFFSLHYIFNQFQYLKGADKMGTGFLVGPVETGQGVMILN